MTVLVKVLIESKYAANAATTEYTSPNSTKTLVDKFTGTNGSGNTLNLTVYVVPNGGTADPTNQIIAKTLIAGECYTFPEIVGRALEQGDFIAILASAATSIVIRSEGRQIT
jgi:hypothetical protein